MDRVWDEVSEQKGAGVGVRGHVSEAHPLSEFKTLEVSLLGTKYSRIRWLRSVFGSCDEKNNNKN